MKNTGRGLVGKRKHTPLQDPTISRVVDGVRNMTAGAERRSAAQKKEKLIQGHSPSLNHRGNRLLSG